jgi:hypothetical protein
VGSGEPGAEKSAPGFFLFLKPSIIQHGRLSAQARVEGEVFSP